MLNALLLALACAHGPSTTEEAVMEDPAIQTTAEAEPQATEATEATEETEETEAIEDIDAQERAEHSEHEELAAQRVGRPPTPVGKPSNQICGDGTDVSAPLRAAAARAAVGEGGENRLQVVVHLVPGSVTPAALQEPLVAGTLIQGWVTEARLCELAGAEGVESVREPIEASPK